MAARSNMLWSRVDRVSACPTVKYHTDTIPSTTCVDRRRGDADDIFVRTHRLALHGFEGISGHETLAA